MFQVNLFEKELEAHQQEKLSNGMSILEAAVMEHNLLAISHIYKSIKIGNLAHLLRVPALQVCAAFWNQNICLSSRSLFLWYFIIFSYQSAV